MKKFAMCISKHLLYLIVGSSILLAVLCIWYGTLSGNQLNQQTAERWQGSGATAYTQYTVLFAANEQKTAADIEHDIEQMQTFMKQELSLPDGQASYGLFAFSGEATVIAESEHCSIGLRAFGIGGDYFYFHPLPLKAGAYLRKDAIDKQTVILDELAAWQLFGSRDIVGKKLVIIEQIVTVSGVVEREYRSRKSDATQEIGQIYLPIMSAQRLSDLTVTNLELVLPNILKGYPNALLSRLFPKQNCVTITNSGRFSPLQIFCKMLHDENFVIQEKALAYPDCENAARVLEYRLVKLLRCIFLLAVFWLVTLCVAARKLAKYRKKRDGKELVRDGFDFIARYYKGLRQKL